MKCVLANHKTWLQPSQPSQQTDRERHTYIRRTRKITTKRRGEIMAVKLSCNCCSYLMWQNLIVIFVKMFRLYYVRRFWAATMHT